MPLQSGDTDAAHFSGQTNDVTYAPSHWDQLKNDAGPSI